MRGGVRTQVHNKTRQTETKMSKQSMFAAAMAGEISPDIMFGKNGQRGGNMGADVCGGV